MYPKLLVIGPLAIAFLRFPVCTAGGTVLFVPVKAFAMPQVTLHTYGMLIALAFLSGIALIVRRAPQEGIEPARMLDLGFWILVCAIVGGKVALVLVHFKEYVRNPGEIWSTVRSAGVYYGGFLLALAGAVVYMRRRRLPLLKVMDLCAPAIALGQGIARLGCFSAGCCYGRPSQLAVAVVFENQYSHFTTGVPLHVPLHPTQLYLSATGFFLFCALLILSRRKKYDGQIFLFYILGYGVLRFAIEFLRGDDRGFQLMGWLSLSQIISIAAMAVSVFLLFVLPRKERADPAVSTEGGRSDEGTKD